MLQLGGYLNRTTADVYARLKQSILLRRRNLLCEARGELPIRIPRSGELTLSSSPAHSWRGEIRSTQLAVFGLESAF